jgi:HAD superfamily phosphatase (TIGR01668 family)
LKFRRLTPDLFVNSIMDIPLKELIKKGKKNIILDLDNTITEWNNPEIREDIVMWFKRLNQYGISACLVSNNNGSRVREVADKLGVPFVARATKPRRRAFKNAMNVLNCLPKESVVVGDQLFTDILGGNRMGIFTILVPPLSSREFIGTKIMRRFERVALKIVKNNQ